MLGDMNINKMENLAKKIRQNVFYMISNKGRGHYGGSLSCIEILISLYYKIMNSDDKFVLSKAHAGATLYAILADKGIIKSDLLKTYGMENSKLGVHPENHLLPGIEFSCGSLGHGLGFSIGLALGLRKKKQKGTIFVLIGDGESQEGSIWEAALFAAHHQIDNIIAITDYNKKQGSGYISNILELNPVIEKWKSFGWDTVEIDGHSLNDLINTFEMLNQCKGKPKMIIAHTIKGKGLSLIENREHCHSDSLSDDELSIARIELL